MVARRSAARRPMHFAPAGLTRGRWRDRILNGEKPADLRVQAATKFGLVINAETTKALGLPIPPTVSALADEVTGGAVMEVRHLPAVASSELDYRQHLRSNERLHKCSKSVRNFRLINQPHVHPKKAPAEGPGAFQATIFLSPTCRR